MSRRAVRQRIRAARYAAVQTTVLFAVLLPAVGVISIPFVGVLLDRCHIATTFFVMNGIGLLFGIMRYSPQRTAGRQRPTVCLTQAH